MSSKIIDAVKNGHYTQLGLYKRHNYNFNVKSQTDGSNILMAALEIPEAHKRFKMFEYLLKQDLIDVRDCDKNGHDVFFTAVIREREPELSILMKMFHTEIDWSRTDNFGKTLLHYAVASNNLKILETLLRYCSKYKISVDIPDKINKITPYLLACRLNHQHAADLLLEIGHASKMQADQSSFFDAERWKQEGQVEKLKSYLKSKEDEMNYAKLCGNVKLYKELNSLSKQLDSEVIRNSEILPVLAKIIIDHDHNSSSSNSSSAHTKDNNNNLVQLPSTSRLFSNHRRRITNRDRSPNSHVFITSLGQSQSSIFSPNDSFASLGASGGSHYQIFKSKSSLDLNPSLNNLLRQTMNNLSKKRSTTESPQMNSLLEMANGQTTVDHFVGSKSEADQSLELNQNVNNQSQHQQHNHAHHHSTSSSHHSHHHHNSNLVSSISNIFYEASMQKTGNFRSGISYNPAPVKLERTTKVSSPLKVKSNLSTFRLIAISEESRLSNYQKRVTFRKRHNSNTNAINNTSLSHNDSPSKKNITQNRK